MAATGTSRVGRMSDKGYSLVEVLTVLVILALLTAVTGVFLRGRGKPFEVRVAALDLASCLRLARASAVARNQEQVVVIDLDQRRYACPDKSGPFPTNPGFCFAP